MSNIVVLNAPLQVDDSNASTTLADTCAFLGLDAQAVRYRSLHDASRAFDRARLSADQLTVWRAYCPTSYTTERLRAYSFDTVPVQVLELWALAKREFSFDSGEMRTTEKTIFQDPILLGWHGPVAYLLARWGAEAPAHVTFDDVCKAVCDACSTTIEEIIARWMEARPSVIEIIYCWVTDYQTRRAKHVAYWRDTIRRLPRTYPVENALANLGYPVV